MKSLIGDYHRISWIDSGHPKWTLLIGQWWKSNQSQTLFHHCSLHACMHAVLFWYMQEWVISTFFDITLSLFYKQSRFWLSLKLLNFEMIWASKLLTNCLIFHPSLGWNCLFLDWILGVSNTTRTKKANFGVFLIE